MKSMCICLYVRVCVCVLLCVHVYMCICVFINVFVYMYVTSRGSVAYPVAQLAYT